MAEVFLISDHEEAEIHCVNSARIRRVTSPCFPALGTEKL